MTLHLNKKHVLFQVDRSEEVLKTDFLVTTKETSAAELKRQFWNVLNVVLESFCFAQETKAVFISIRYHKTSQTQDVKSQSTKRSLRSLAQPKRDSAFEQKDVLFQVERSEEVLKKAFLVTTEATSPWGFEKTFLERTQRHFGKFVFSFRWNRPKIFGRFVRKSSKQLHTIQNDEDYVSKKIKSCFSKYSISQDISNAGCKEPKYQM